VPGGRQALNATRGVALAAELEVATSLAARTRGLLGRRSLPPGAGLMLDPCSSVHTWFMHFPIDVVFLDRQNRVVGLKHGLRPFRAAGAWRGVRTLELPAGTIAATGTSAGDHVVFEASGSGT
jgi:uncharacterized membrane protein (UPF0127 family)